MSGPNNYSSEDPLAEPNLLFEQIENGRFVSVTPQGGTSDLLIGSSHGVAEGDIDGDGGVDLVVVNSNKPVTILRNVVPNRGNWIAFRVLDKNGTDAVGAQVELVLDDGSSFHSQVQTARGYASAHDPRVHFGLSNRSPKKVRIAWPDGRKTVIESLQIDTVHTVRYAE